MVKLFIENREIELDKSVQFAINKQFEDVTNPTTIINSWSKTVSIPFTTRNNNIFGHIFNPDKVNVNGVPNDLLPSMYIHRTESYWATYKKNTGEYIAKSRFTTTAPSFDCAIVVRHYLGDTGGVRFTSTSKGYKTYTFTKDSSFDNIGIYCNYTQLGTSTQDLGTVYFDASKLEDGKQYTISFTIKQMPSQTTPYIDCVVNGLCLVEGTRAYKWEQIYEFNDIGIYFNPLKKLDFRLEWDSTVLMTGYAKLNEVKQTNGNGTYEITLFGELGKVFSEMKKITFDTSSEDSDYIIDGSEYVDELINKELVYNSWNSSAQTQSTLYKKMYVNSGGNKVVNPNYKVTDIIGFAPNNSFSEGFEYDSVQTDTTESTKFSTLLGEEFKDITGVEPETVIPNGLLPRAIGEYRSYLQLPFIYWNKLFQIFQAKAEEVTGYEFNLDNDWFNTSNPYWYNLVYMLKQFDIKDGGTSLNTYRSTGKHAYVDTIPPNTWPTADEPYLFESTSFAYRYIYDGTKSQWTTERNIPITSSHFTKTEQLPIVEGNMRIKLSPNERVTQVFNVNGELELYYGKAIQGLSYNRDVYKGFYYSPDVVTCVNLKYTGANGTVRRQVGAILQSNANQQCVNYANSAEAMCTIPRNCNRMNYIPGSTSSYRGTGCVWNFTLNFPETNLFYSEFGDYVDVSIETNCWFHDGAAAQMPYGRQSYTSGGMEATPPAWSDKYQFATMMNFNSEMRVTSGIFRSGSKFTLNDLWNKDVSVFDEILRYCKMFRIGVKVDEANKQLLFTPIENYFNNYSVVDWTNKIDKSKDFTITPITFEDKYVLFNYEDGETKNVKNYKEKYGFNYGEYRLTTDYNFNNNTCKLFNGQKPSNIISLIVLTWDTLFRDNKIIYRVPVDECYIDNGDDDNKMVDTFGQFYFHNGLKTFTITDMPAVTITDDSKLMSENQLYFYTRGFYDPATFVLSETYPYLSLYRGDNMITYTVPKECYVKNVDYSTKNGIYTNFWENYLNERYNVNNKIVTCYMRLKPSDFISFDFNHFIKIGNQIYMVNKIYDYDVTSNNSTKVDLITVQDVTGYTN